jgi:hypothetical protein
MRVAVGIHGLCTVPLSLSSTSSCRYERMRNAGKRGRERGCMERCHRVGDLTFTATRGCRVVAASEPASRVEVLYLVRSTDPNSTSGVQTSTSGTPVTRCAADSGKIYSCVTSTPIRRPLLTALLARVYQKGAYPLTWPGAELRLTRRTPKDLSTDRGTRLPSRKEKYLREQMFHIQWKTQGTLSLESAAPRSAKKWHFQLAVGWISSWGCPRSGPTSPYTQSLRNY